MTIFSKFCSFKGFSLLELSVSLVVVGVIAGGVVTSYSVMNNAKLRVVIKEYNEHLTAFNRFNEKYKYWPGDMPNATKYWSGTTDGDGDFTYTWSTDGYYAWHQMNLAGLIRGTYAGFSGENIVGKNIPKSLYNDGGYHFSGRGLYFGKYHAADRAVTAVLTPTDAQYLDAKMDDGMPQTGYYRSDSVYLASSGGALTWASCINNTTSSATFILTTTTVVCGLYYILSGV